MKYKYFIGYKYHRIQEEVNENNEKIIKQWDSYSNDEFIIDYSLDSIEDIRKLENHIYRILKKECKKQNQQVTALLILGIYLIWVGE